MWWPNERSRTVYKFGVSYQPKDKDKTLALTVVEGPSAYDVRAWVTANLGTVRGMELVPDGVTTDHKAAPLAKSALQLAQEHSQSLLEQGRREGRAEAQTIVQDVVHTFIRNAATGHTRRYLGDIRDAITKALDVK
jgi:hypothetical protein